MTTKRSRRRDAELDEVVPHLRADGDQRRRASTRATRSSSRKKQRPQRARSTRAARGRGRCGRRSAACDGRRAARRPGRPSRPWPCACAGSAAARAGSAARGVIVATRSRSGEISRPSSSIWIDLDAELVGDERHRVLAARERAGHERRVVAALPQARRQIRDVQRGPAHVEARDDAEDLDAAGQTRATIASAVSSSPAARSTRGS